VATVPLIVRPKAGQPGQYEFSLEYAFANDAPAGYIVTVTVTDDEGARQTAASWPSP